MKWSEKEKILVRRVLKAIKEMSNSTGASIMLHPGNGQPKASVSQSIESLADGLAALWGIEIGMKPSQETRREQKAREELERRVHRTPRRYVSRSPRDATPPGSE